jgi:hypothetical protein
MNRFLRLVSGVAVFVIAAFFSFGMLVNVLDGRPQVISSVNGTVVNVLVCIVILLSLVAAYLLISDGIKSK